MLLKIAITKSDISIWKGVIISLSKKTKMIESKENFAPSIAKV